MQQPATASTTLPPTSDITWSAWLLHSLTRVPLPVAAASERVLVGQGIPAISKALLNKIRRWEYVDLAELLPGVGSDTANAAAPQGFPFSQVARWFTPKNRQITSNTDWVAVEPAATLKLLAYMLTVIKASQQYDGLYWLSYDTNYHINAAASGNKAWSRLDTDLYTRFFTGRAKPAVVCMECPQTGAKRDMRKRSAALGPESPAANQRRWPGDVYAEFNAKGACSFGQRWKFRHACGDCSCQHAGKACPSKQA